MNFPYDDIISHPYPFDMVRPRMSSADRAAQFSPFAALAGYDASLQETARHTEEKIQLTESAKAALDRKLQLLSLALGSHPGITVTFFEPDCRKQGGTYRTVSGTLLKIDTVHRCLTLRMGPEIWIEDILEIDSDLFRHML